MWITMRDTAAGCVWVRDRLSRESGLRLGKVGYRVSTQHMGAASAGYGAAFPCGAGGGVHGFGRRLDGAGFMCYTQAE